jgi:transcriptional regulator with XRE-family HTH domain
VFKAIVRSPADFGMALQQARLAAGMTQRDLAAMLGVSQKYVWEMESGKGVAAVERLLGAFKATGVKLIAEVPEGDLLG